MVRDARSTACVATLLRGTHLLEAIDERGLLLRVRCHASAVANRFEPRLGKVHVRTELALREPMQ